MGTTIDELLTNWPALRSLYMLARASLFSLSVLPAAMCAPRDLPDTVRDHSLAFQRVDGGARVVATSALATANGPTVAVVGVGRGDIQAFALPTSELGDLRFEQVGETHPYTNWQNSGTALYVAAATTDGGRHKVRATTAVADEITLAAVTVAGTKVRDVSWAEALAGSAITSGKVTTTGPATLIAFWWGDAGVRYDKKAMPGDGFSLVDSVLESGALVQCAVAVKRVTEAGSYDVTWKAFPTQGAQLWLVAVE